MKIPDLEAETLRLELIIRTVEAIGIGDINNYRGAVDGFNNLTNDELKDTIAFWESKPKRYLPINEDDHEKHRTDQ